MIRKGIAIILLIQGICLNTHAQQDLGPLSGFNEEKDGAFYFTVDFTHPMIDFSGVNKELQQAIYPKMESPDVVVGFGFDMHIQQYIFGMTWNYGTKSVSEEVFRTETVYKDFNFMIFGWDFIKNYRESFFPYLGIRGVDLQYTYYEKNDSNGNLKSYLNDDLDMKQFGFQDFDLDLGLGFSLNRTILMKIKAGYLISIQDSKWFIENYDKALTSEPALDYNFYITATIGLGGYF